MKISNLITPHFNAKYCQTYELENTSRDNFDIGLITKYANYKPVQERIQKLPDDLWICADLNKKGDSVEFSLAQSLSDDSDIDLKIKKYIVSSIGCPSTHNCKYDIENELPHIKSLSIKSTDAHSPRFMEKLDDWLNMLSKVFNNND